MYNYKNYLSKEFVTSDVRAVKSYAIETRVNLLVYLFFQILMEKRYIQFFYFFNYFFSLSGLRLFDVRLINFMLSKFLVEQELSFLFIQSNFLMNLSMLRRQYMSKHRRRSRGDSLNLNYTYLNYSHYKENWATLFYSVTRFYSSMFFFDINRYWHLYMVLFFNQPASNIDYNNTYSYFSYKVMSNRYFVLNYYFIKSIFKNFIFLLLNTAILNAVPFFVYPKNLEKEVLLFYRFFLYFRTSLVYSLGIVKQLVIIKNLAKFENFFGIPSFFFFVDITSSMKNLCTVRGFNIPVGGLVTSNMRSHNLDYPLFISRWNQGITFTYLIFLMQIFFAGLNKRKRFLWNYFIRMRIIYLLKQKKLFYV